MVALRSDLPLDVVTGKLEEVLLMIVGELALRLLRIIEVEVGELGEARPVALGFGIVRACSAWKAVWFYLCPARV